VTSAGPLRKTGPLENAGPVKPSRRLEEDFYRRDSLAVAASLLNKLLVSADGRIARLVEVEAYRGVDDPASHAYRGRTPRTEVMWGPPGRLYVYFSYGMHWCANVVTGEDGEAQAVLLRAAEPLAGLEAMRQARWRAQKRQSDRDLCRGPGRLAQAFGIGRAQFGLDLAADGPLWLADDGTPPPSPPAMGPRIGISVAADRPWRYWVPGDRAVSGR
jgi:DNA-3-methyladenine glycosylase